LIAIIDYGMGNVQSVANGFARLGFDTVLTGDLEVIKKSSTLVLPGVGAFGRAVEELKKKGLLEHLQERERQGTYILGICLGLQLFFEESQEDPGWEGLSFLSGQVLRFPPSVKVPHMGWNRVYHNNDNPLFDGIPSGCHFYFAHSFYGFPKGEEKFLARCSYGVGFPAALKKKNVYGLQFHPEKSGEWGLKVLLNFGRMISGAGNTSH